MDNLNKTLLSGRGADNNADEFFFLEDIQKIRVTENMVYIDFYGTCIASLTAVSGLEVLKLIRQKREGISVASSN